MKFRLTKSRKYNLVNIVELWTRIFCNFINMLPSKTDLNNMIFIFGDSNRNCLLACRIYSQLYAEGNYPDGNHPDERSFWRVLTRFVETWSINYSKHEHISVVSNDSGVMWQVYIYSFKNLNFWEESTNSIQTLYLP